MDIFDKPNNLTVTQYN